MSTKQFKAESKKLLDMMINSIYTHKEIFLRELISNASDALDKLYFKSLTDTSVGLNKDDFAIMIEADKQARTLKITDNGIGMTEKELEQNLGTIAKSGSLAFKKENELGDDVDIIGQFGVGFYSAFMVAKEVIVRSKAYGEEGAFEWRSKGAEGYTVEPCDKEAAGTEITLILKDNTEEENYDKYLDQYQLQTLVKKYSDYIRFPIKMEVEHTHYEEEDKEPTVTKEIETLNTMTPIWKRSKSELTDDDYNNFRVYFDAEYGKIKNPMKIDITTGDEITPAAIQYNYQLLFDERSISVMAYTLETILAEKYETIIRRNIGTTRARDFYDLYALYRIHKDEIRIPILRLAVEHTARKRGSLELLSDWVEIIDDIRSENALHSLWKNYIKDNPYASGLTFDEVVNTVHTIGRIIQ